ncbi:hypothetical protein LJC28_03430 [Dysgonomonas sp. OttesenSCG-928-D17]|nr:hypothetical protein [Dysgonomonas sp. OttesenSCG-928-D17]
MEMEIETLRLRIVPLSVEHFRLFLDETEKMELQMGLTPSREIPDEHTRQAMEDLYAKAIAYPEHYYWYTNWQIILKSENKSIGSACFMKDESALSQRVLEKCKMHRYRQTNESIWWKLEKE